MHGFLCCASNFSPPPLSLPLTARNLKQMEEQRSLLSERALARYCRTAARHPSDALMQLNLNSARDVPIETEAATTTRQAHVAEIVRELGSPEYMTMHETKVLISEITGVAMHLIPANHPEVMRSTTPE